MKFSARIEHRMLIISYYGLWSSCIIKLIDYMSKGFEAYIDFLDRKRWEKHTTISEGIYIYNGLCKSKRFRNSSKQSLRCNK
uniref:Uncharacterized protein n=1 Tax=Glossina morsitans morsitans TaxID=37546 RepID=A0A1B0GBP3_GLOMM